MKKFLAIFLLAVGIKAQAADSLGDVILEADTYATAVYALQIQVNDQWSKYNSLFGSGQYVQALALLNNILDNSNTLAIWSDIAYQDYDLAYYFYNSAPAYAPMNLMLNYKTKFQNDVNKVLDIMLDYHQYCSYCLTNVP